MQHRLTPMLMRTLFLTLLLATCPPGHHARAEPADTASSNDVLLEARLAKTRVYLQEAVPVTITLLVGAVSVRNIGYPKFEGSAFRGTVFSPPHQGSVIRDGREYATYEFTATLNPRKHGEVELGPAELHYDLLLPGDGAAAFFGGNEPRSMIARSSPVTLSVMPLPTRGRPIGFTGAVGQFTLERKSDPAAPRTGEAISLLTRITGVGNIDNFSCESISLPGVHAYPPKSLRAPHRLTCEQVLLTEPAIGELIIPAASISFFDPDTGQYRTASSPPITLAPADVAPSPTQVEPPASLISAPSVSTPEGASYWPLWATLAVVPLALAMAIRLRNSRLHAVPRHHSKPSSDPLRLLAEAETALSSDDSTRFYEAVFRLVQLSAAKQCNLPSSGMTLNAMTRDGEPLPHYLVALFQECDAVRYGGAPRDRQEMLRTLKSLQARFAQSW